jgi:hypothetical protein
MVWILLVLVLARKALTAEYFHTNVEPADPFWDILEHRFRVPDHVRRAVFRAYIVYGAARVVSWFLWARLLNPNRGVETMDLSWTGPGWVQVPPRFQVASTWSGFATSTIVGLAGTALTAYAAWRIVKRLPERSAGAEAATRSPDCVSDTAATRLGEVLHVETRFTAQPEVSIPVDGSIGPSGPTGAIRANRAEERDQIGKKYDRPGSALHIR